MTLNYPHAVASGIALLALTLSANAAVVFSNNFESNTTGFSAGTQQLLPVDNLGFGSANKSNYLGLFDFNDVIELSLSGLTPGTTYGVSFDLFGGLTLDGNSFGPDRFTVSAGLGTGVAFVASSAPFLDATFANFPGSVQTYSDATPTGGVSGTTFGILTGADVSFIGDTATRYGIYYFSHGPATNPQLSFIAPGPSTTLRFAASGLQPEGDEFFAIDNVIITGPDAPVNGRVPDTGTTLFLLAAAFGTMVWIRRLAIA